MGLKYIFLILLTFCESAIANNSVDWSELIDISGRQRMLTQKITKEVLLVAIGQNKESNIKNLEKSVKLYDDTLKKLIAANSKLDLVHAEQQRILRQLKNVNGKWLFFMQHLQNIIENSKSSKSIDSKDVEYVIENNLSLLKHSNRVVRLYERASNIGDLDENDVAKSLEVNLAGKQRMISQRLAKEFLLIHYKYKVENNMISLKTSLDIFGKTLKGLQDGDVDFGLNGTTNPDILMQLSKVENIWGNMYDTLIKTTYDGFTNQEGLQLVEELNTKLLKEMHQAVIKIKSD